MSLETTGGYSDHHNSNISSNVSENDQETFADSSNIDVGVIGQNLNLHTYWDISDVEDESIADSCSYINDQSITYNRASNNALVSTSNESPNIVGSISVQNSSDITFGNKNFFNGPVVIKQVIIDKNSNNDQNENKDFDFDDLKVNIRSSNHRCSRKICIYVGLVTSIAIVAFVVMLVFIFHKQTDNKAKEEMQTTTITATQPTIATIHPVTLNPETEEKGLYEYIDRSSWGAMPPRSYIDINLPLKRVIISHTVTGDCVNLKECSAIMRSIQRADMDPARRNYSDIGINFFVGGDSRAYEGRGYRVGAHTKEYGANRNSICIAFIGNFNKDMPLEGQLEASKRIIDDGLKSNKIHPDYRLYGQRQFFATDSPGNFLFPLITTWPHWSAELLDVE